MKRFADFSIAEIDAKRQNLIPICTKKATSTAVSVLREYLREKGQDDRFENMNKNDLDKLLSNFYLEARTRTGDLYKKTSLTSLRYGINRYLKSLPTNFDIIADASFCNSNEAFKVAVQELKSVGKAAIEHFPAITAADRQKLYTSIFFNPEHPTGLFNKVQFDVRYYFCRRGNENMDKMSKKTFDIQTDANTGRKYVTKKDELTKNHQSDSDSFSGFMPETSTADCPVASFIKYLSKLNPASDRLWCYPRDSFLETDPYWYTLKPVGKNSLQKFLPKLSEQCGLSQKYTNHSIRATGATVLHQNKHAPAEIQAVTGHKSLNSLSIYQETSSQQKLEMGDSLHRNIAGNSTRTATQLSVVCASTSNKHDDSIDQWSSADEDSWPVDTTNPTSSNKKKSCPAAIFKDCTINNLTIVYKK